MPTLSQINANFLNAQKSTGPKTEAGKDKVRLNSLTHGLCSAEIVLPGEDRQAFEDLRRSYYQTLAPVGPIEMAHVETMLVSFWRLRRATKLEAAIYTEEGIDTKALNRFLRYTNQFQRAFDKSRIELEKLQTLRREAEAEGVDLEQTTTTSIEIGLAPQNTPEPEALNKPRPIVDRNGKVIRPLPGVVL